MASATKTKQGLLDGLKARIEKDDPTPELRESATQLVFADGNVDADIVFIGEAPGKNEDEQGKPFVGAAGKFLNEMLAMIGLERKDIYITNIVKYRPPNNRDPEPSEKAAFLPYLQEQLDIIQPKLIVTLGRHSMDVLLPGLKISQVHGQPKRYFALIPTILKKL
jgi:uracil-DNA glycosylase family 4